MVQRRYSNLWLLCVLVMGLFCVAGPLPATAQGVDSAPVLRPYRVLVVAGIQMRDDYVIHNAWDFGDVIALLKLWGIPFDILRLDARAMTLDDLVNGTGQAKYGAIIWTARQDQYPWQSQNYDILDQAVNNYHISLIALANKIQEPEIQAILDLTYNSWGSITNNVVVTTAGSSHFISRTWAGSTPASQAFPGGNGPMVTAGTDVEVLAAAGTWPQLAARTIDDDTRTRAVWIGGDPDNVYYTSPTFIEFMRRSLVWAMGYALYKDYGHSVVHRMDDPGGAQTAYLGSWLYAQLDQTTIQNTIIAHLQSHGANLGVGFNPGYPWIPTQSIVHSTGLDFVDPHGTRQNVVSTYAGLLDGMAADVIEVQSHGLTHMVPDLSTPIAGSTNWWNGTIGGEWDQVGWYREFYDTRRSVEVDAVTQAARLAQSADWLEQDFGVRPLIFIPGGHAISGDRYEGGSGTAGTITVTLDGTQHPGADYTVFYGNTTWTNLGTLTTDAAGDAQASFGFPSSMLGTTDQYFTVNRAGTGTQFIAYVEGPLGYDFDFSLRDYTEMTPAERSRFYLANETLDAGSVVGSHTYYGPHIAANYTYKLAGEAGYGLASDTTSHYLGDDYVITLRVCTTSYVGGTADVQDDLNRGVPAVVYFHDRDIALNQYYFGNWLNTLDATWSDLDYLSQNEWVGYMHAALDAHVPTPYSAQFDFNYDSHYGRYFGTHPSTWTLHLSDELLADFQTMGQTQVIVDGVVVDTVDAATYFSELQDLDVPAGTGLHTILFEGSDPTAVTLFSFTATSRAGRILLSWETASELEVTGFHVYGSQSEDGHYSRLNPELIPAQAPGSAQGAVYYWQGAQMEPGRTLYFKLGVIDTQGSYTLYGPVKARVTHSAYLPLVTR